MGATIGRNVVDREVDTVRTRTKVVIGYRNADGVNVEGVPVGLSSRYWCVALKVNTPAARFNVVLPSPGPQVTITVWVSKASRSLNVPVSVAVSFSLIGDRRPDLSPPE